MTFVHTAGYSIQLPNAHTHTAAQQIKCGDIMRSAWYFIIRRVFALLPPDYLLLLLWVYGVLQVANVADF